MRGQTARRRWRFGLRKRSGSHELIAQAVQRPLVGDKRALSFNPGPIARRDTVRLQRQLALLDHAPFRQKLTLLSLEARDAPSAYLLSCVQL